MKNSKLLLLLVTSSFLVGCSTQNTSNSNSSNSPGDSTTTSDSQSGGGGESTTSEDPHVTPTTSIQDMNILHAWNWKMSDIESRLGLIKQAGYGAVQISPMQPKIDGSSWANQSTASQWWKLYQPTDLSIAGNNDNFLGTRDNLTSLCTAAKAQGIKIVVDVVLNHLTTNQGAWKTNYPKHNYSNSINYNNRQSIVKGDMGGLPDLDTHNSTVQNAARELLKSYIDCGVSGFRFDAAKHIETPDDNSSYSSDFWTVVLGGADAHAISKGLEKPFYYGEILSNPGPGASFSYYTKMMSTVDNEQGDETLEAIVNSNTSKIKTTYKTGVDADHLVLWAESHDTYANDRDSSYTISRDFSAEQINKTYMIQASRKDAATLYLARPSTATGDSALYATIGTVNASSGWRNSEVAAINKFHTRYVSKSEHISIQDNKYFVNVRGSGEFAGAAIVNVNGSSSATISVPGLQNGTYRDLISNNTFTVTNGSVNVTFTNGGCILIPDDGSTPQTTYTSNVVLQNSNPSKYYYAWLFDGAPQVDKWVKLTTDLDAIGFNVGTYSQYVIAEFDSDNPVWNTQNWKSVDFAYGDSQDIYDCNTIPKASS